MDAGADAAASFDTGVELRVEVPATGRVYVRLEPPSVVGAGDAWDLAFEGLDVYTNSGSSGSGKGGAFGPLDGITFLGDQAPQVPFITQDEPGGAFRNWYAYEGSTHALYSRFHTYGVKDGDRIWKVQLLSYYGERDGAAVSALLRVRYAEVGGAAQEITLDGTAGGPNSPADSPSECIDFGTGARSMLTPAAALASSAWHICARRDSIFVNGEKGGPRGITAVDLQAAETATETLSAVQTRTPESTAAAFDAVNRASFDGKTFRGDRIVSAFSDRWIENDAPVNAAWLVVDAAGAQKVLVGFVRFEGATTASPGTVVMRIKPVKG
ncbi:MAG: HmuY family protein [Labilithrix sp.]|nr:HmuY family protein [Labilithrix sp.]MCW5817047.1 HmuY family protein [Labilithrix sp.]